MALLLGVMLVATTLLFHAITVSAEVMDLTDYVPINVGTMLDGKVIKITSYNGTSYDHGVEIKELENNIFEFYTKDTRATIPSSVGRPYGGLEYDLTGKTITKGDKLVFIAKVRKVNDSDVVPNLIFGMADGSMGGSAAGWGWKTQTVYAKDITSTEWQTIVQEIEIPYNGTVNTKAILGLGVGSTYEGYKNKPEFEFRPGAAVEIDMNSVYLGTLTAYDINFELSSSAATVGETLTGNAAIVDRIGGTTGYDQNFTYYVTDPDGNTVEGFEITEPNVGEVSVKAGSAVLPGNYVVLAVSDVYPGFKKTFPISVTYGELAKADGTKIEVTASDDTTVGVTDRLTLTASAVNDGEMVDHTSAFTWTAINTDKMSVCEDIMLTPAQDTKSAELSLALDITEGNYYIMVASNEMCTLFEITVDKSGDIENIASKITDEMTDELAEDMDTYLAVLELSDTICSSADVASLASVVTGTIAEDGEDNLNLETLKEYFTKSAIVSLYNQNDEAVALYDEKGMFTFADELNLSDMDEGVTLWELFAGKEEMLRGISEEETALMITDEGRLEMQASLIENAPYATVNAFKSKVTEAILLYTLAYPNVNGFGYVEDVLTEANLKAAGIDATDYLALTDKLAINESAAGTLYTAEELEEALKITSEEDEEEEEEPDDKYKPSGTGSLGSFGGGGGGSIGGGGSSADKTEPKDEPKEEEKPVQPIVGKFADVPDDHWACTDIYFLKEIGVIDGTTDTTFTPDSTVTREQFLKMLVLAFKLSGTENGKTFTDVKDGAWYASYVDMGVASGVINGMSDGSFGIGKSITRQDACVMLARALGLDADAEVSLSFIDADNVSDYAVNSVGTLTEYAIINGFDDNAFKPNETCTRAQAAKLVANAITIFNSIQQGGSN